MALNLQITQLIFWVGVITIIPTFNRFYYSAPALLWHRLFPTRTLEFRYHDEDTGTTKALTVKVPRKNGKILTSLTNEAITESLRQK